MDLWLQSHKASGVSLDLMFSQDNPRRKISHTHICTTMASRKLLVVGATGQQGGALIEALLANKSSFDIYGLTRNKASPSATKLSGRGVHMIEGDVSAPLPIFKQLGKSVYGVFSVTTLCKDEEGEAKPLIDAAIANNVQHFVYTSADRGGPAKSDKDPTVVPHFITKFNVEKHLIAKAAKSPQRMMWTILRPVSFMDNFTPTSSARSWAGS